MRVVHCLGWYAPDSAGGTEAYVAALAREQQDRGADVHVIAARDGDEGARYRHEDIDVTRYPVPAGAYRSGTRARPHGRFERFEAALAELAPDVFHLHSMTPGAGVAHLRAARRLGARTVVTAHVPGFVCARGTMLRMGQEACDGRIEARQCVPCWLHHKGLGASLAEPLGGLLRGVPPRFAGVVPGRAGSLLSAADRVRNQRRVVGALAQEADRVVAVCSWLQEALRDNGVPEDKLVLCRQAVTQVYPAGTRGPRPRRQDASEPPATLRLGFFGRTHPIKGLDLLVRALRQGPRDQAITLRVHAISNDDEERAHLAEVRALAGGDERIRIMAAVPREEVCDAMRECDVVAVPSRCLETGPLVAMDALAAGIPVLGSDLGGLRELVEPGVTGWLEPSDDLPRWRARLEALALPGAARLRWDPARPGLQTWSELASRMLDLYAELS